MSAPGLHDSGMKSALKLAADRNISCFNRGCKRPHRCYIINKFVRRRPATPPLITPRSRSRRSAMEKVVAMIWMTKCALVCGTGSSIGGHLVKRLKGFGVCG
jgi:hypothetical protein